MYRVLQARARVPQLQRVALREFVIHDVGCVGLKIRKDVFANAKPYGLWYCAPPLGTQCARAYSAKAPPHKDTPEEHDRKVHAVKEAIASHEHGIDKRVWPIAASTMLMGTAIGVVLPVMPLFAKELGLSSTDFGMVISIMGLTRVVFNIPLATVSDRLGRRPLLIAGPVVTSLAMLGTGLSRSLADLLACRFTTGISGAAQMTGASLYLSDISTAANRARTLAPMSAAWSAGAAVGPALGGFIAQGWGLQAPFYFVASAIALVAVNNYMRLPETHPKHEKLGKGSVTTITQDMSKAFSQWGELLKSRDVRSIAALHTIFWITTSGSQLTLLPILASQNLGMSPAGLGGLFGLMALINVIGSQPAAHISDKFGRKWTLVPGTLISAMAVAMCPLATSYEQLALCVTAWGIGNSVLGSTPTAFMADVTDLSKRSQAFALLRTGGDLGLMIGAGVMGFLADAIDVSNAMTANAIFLAAASVGFSLLVKEPKR